MSTGLRANRCTGRSPPRSGAASGLAGCVSGRPCRPPAPSRPIWESHAASWSRPTSNSSPRATSPVRRAATPRSPSIRFHRRRVGAAGSAGGRDRLRVRPHRRVVVPSGRLAAFGANHPHHHAERTLRLPRRAWRTRTAHSPERLPQPCPRHIGPPGECRDLQWLRPRHRADTPGARGARRPQGGRRGPIR